VLGFLPGTGAGEGTPDWAALDDELIVVMAQYDTPPASPDGAFYPGANDNASGLAVMMETLRTMRDTGYQPYRSMLFVAYSGEGETNGFPYEPDVKEFLQAKPGYATNFRLAAVIDLKGLGWGTDMPLEISSNGSARLVSIFKSSAQRNGVPLVQADENVTFSELFRQRSMRDSGEEAPLVLLRRKDWQILSNIASDTPAQINPDNLHQAGETLSLSLMVLGRDKS
jgi:hypothetical protein